MNENEKVQNETAYPVDANEVRDKALQESILAALEERQFFICLQPKFLLPERKITSAEVLLRWSEPEGGIVFPVEFLPVATRAGLTELLDLYALEEACKCMRQWIDEQKTVVPLSINVASASLQTPGFVDAATACVTKYNIPHEYIEFEFTSQFAKTYPVQLANTIAQFSRNRFRCSMDGFAMPSAMLPQAFAFQIDTLKLNCLAYCAQDERDGMRDCIHVFEAAKEYGKPVFCEGVETPNQFEVLLHANCTHMQGYALSMPVTVGLFSKMLERHA